MKTNFIYATGLLLMGVVACNNNKAEREKEAEKSTSQAIDSMMEVQERNRVLDSIEFSASGHTLEQAPMPEHEKHTPAVHHPKTEPKDHTATKTETAAPVPAPSPTPESPSTGTVANGGGSGSSSSTVASAPEEKKKKGINNTVKGAVIGAGAGAVGGAVINKSNPGKGAIIGGIIGAGAGAVTGVILDKNKKKKQAAKDSSATKSTTKEPNKP